MSMAGGKAGRRGFTLIELMVVVATLGIFLAIAVPAAIQAQRFVESEIALQKALQALRAQVEIIHETAYEKLAGSEPAAFAESSGVSDLADGRGEVTVSPAPDLPGVVAVTVTVFWEDAWKGASSIHTVVYRAPAGRRP